MIAAIVIPNFQSAQKRARRAQTFAAMRELGGTLETYRAQNSHYPPASSVAELAPAVHSASGSTLPTRDAWGHEFHYLCWPKAQGGCEHHTLASAGQDGVFERDDLRGYSGEQTPVGDYDRDIVMLDGNFLQYPAGR